MFAVSTTNLVVTATITSSSADAVYGADNLKTPQSCFLPARTTGVGDQWWVIDYGTAQPVGVWGLIKTNFSSCRIQANATDSWATPTYNQNVALTQRNRWNTRYNWQHLPPTGTQTFRFNRVFVPSQSTLDGAAYYSLGGVHAGVRQSPLRDIAWNWKVLTIPGRTDVKDPVTDRVVQRLQLSEPFTRITGIRRQARMPAGYAEGVSDDLASWLEIERQWMAADYALVTLHDNNPSACWMMRLLTAPSWEIDPAFPVSDAMELEEVY